MMEVEVKIKRVGDYRLPVPRYETDGAAGMDLRADLSRQDSQIGYNLLPGERVAIPVGFAFSIPYGYEGEIRGRSGNGRKYGIHVIGSRTIDSDYRGEVQVFLINLGKEEFIIEHMDRIAQMLIRPVSKAKLTEVDELDETIRGENGFGHTGKR